MTETKRDRCWTPHGAYSQVMWDPDTGRAEICDYDSADRLIARHEWELYAEPVDAARDAGEHRTFDPEGQQTATRRIAAPAA